METLLSLKQTPKGSAVVQSRISHGRSRRGEGAVWRKTYIPMGKHNGREVFCFGLPRLLLGRFPNCLCDLAPILIRSYLITYFHFLIDQPYFNLRRLQNIASHIFCIRQQTLRPTKYIHIRSTTFICSLSITIKPSYTASFIYWPTMFAFVSQLFTLDTLALYKFQKLISP